MNREIVVPGGAGVYPLTGDVESDAGSPLVTVVGIQGRTVTNPFLQGGENLQYNGNTNEWIPTLRACVFVNGVPVSDDFTVTVNVARPIKINGA